MITEFPLLVFTVLTGTAAGAYVGAALFPRKEEGGTPWALPLVAFILVVVGSLAAVGHLGRPMMVLNVLNNPTSSLTMEGASAGVLALVALIDFAIAKRLGKANRAIRVVGALVGIVCMCIVTSAYLTSYGNPVWTAAPTWPLFAIGDLACGFAFWLFYALVQKPLAIATAVLNLLFACVLAWQASVFAGCGAAGVVQIIIGAVFALIAAIVAFRDAKYPGATVVIVFILAMIALFISRYGFYMASII